MQHNCWQVERTQRARKGKTTVAKMTAVIDDVIQFLHATPPSHRPSSIKVLNRQRLQNKKKDLYRNNFLRSRWRNIFCCDTTQSDCSQCEIISCQRCTCMVNKGRQIKQLSLGIPANHSSNYTTQSQVHARCFGSDHWPESADNGQADSKPDTPTRKREANYSAFERSASREHGTWWGRDVLPWNSKTHDSWTLRTRIPNSEHENHWSRKTRTSNSSRATTKLRLCRTYSTNQLYKRLGANVN